MSDWQPIEQVFDLTPIVDNILAYIAENDDAALAWATGGEQGELPEFKGIYPSASGRLATKFPQVMVLTQECEVKGGESANGDVLIGNLDLVFEFACTGKNADELALKTKDYGKALESLLVNVAIASNDGVRVMTDGCSPEVHAVSCMGYQTAYDIVKGAGDKTASSWLQIGQTRISYQLVASAF